MNIILFLQRKGVIKVIPLVASDRNASALARARPRKLPGLRFEWVKTKVNVYIEYNQRVCAGITKSLRQGSRNIDRYGLLYQDDENVNFNPGKVKGLELEGIYPLKHFVERYSAVLHLIQHPKHISHYAEKVHALCRKVKVKAEAAEFPKTCQTSKMLPLKRCKAAEPMQSRTPSMSLRRSSSMGKM